MDLINSKNYWGLGSTLAITVLVFLIFSLLQTLVLILCSSDLKNYEDVAYMHLGVISTTSSIFASIFLVLFIRLKNRNIKEYLNLCFPQ